MKLRQAQASATYLLPDPGELDQRIVIRRRVDVPADDFGVTPTYPEQIRT
ncbi:head-tail adaptor protein, partial [Salmonella enterica subsp. enterica]